MRNAPFRAIRRALDNRKNYVLAIFTDTNYSVANLAEPADDGSVIINDRVFIC